MRKEIRVGLGIGGVLMAVVVVAMVVKSHTRQRPQDTKVAAVDKGDSDNSANTTDSSPGASNDAGSASSSGPNTTTDPVTAAPRPDASAQPAEKGDPFEQKSSAWDSVLLSGNVPGPAPTITPAAGSSHVAIGDHFKSGSGTAGVTPGSFPPQPIETDPAPSHTHRPTAPITPEPTGSQRGSRTHVVALGETFSTIAKSNYGSSKYYLLIEKANPNVVPERLRPGTKIVLPEMPAAGSSEASDRRGSHASVSSAGASDSATQYVVKSNDSLYRISMHLYGTPGKVDAIYDLNKEAIGADRGRLKLGMVLKLPGPPTSAAR